MDLVPWLLFALAALLVLWQAWRRGKLAREIRQVAGALRIHPPRLETSERVLQPLAEALRLMAGDHAGQLSALSAERDRLAAVLAQMTDGVLIADADGRVKYANPAAGRLFQFDDPAGHSVPEVVRDHRLIDAWRRCQARGDLQTEAVEVPIRHQYLQLVALPDTHGGGSLLLVQDLTRLRRLETVRQDFVSNFSHELRTPLASLKALAETLLGGAMKDPEAGPRFLNRMVTEVDALTQMSQELLELSSIESGGAALRLASVDPVRLLQSASEHMRLQADRAGVAMRVEVSPPVPSVHADSERLEQVLVNLIHNATKFTAAGGEIVLSARETVAPPGDRNAVEFSVRDTGRGIAADDLPRIFERFYRADKARTRGGAGLGLSIARHIVEAHGGRVWAESVEGRGSTFYFTIPRSA